MVHRSAFAVPSPLRLPRSASPRFHPLRYSPATTLNPILLGSLLGSVIGLSVVAGLYLSGWKRGLAERGSRRGLGTANALRWTIASQYQLPLGTFLGIGALAIVYLGPVIGAE